MIGMFSVANYAPAVQEILGAGDRVMPLAPRGDSGEPGLDRLRRTADAEFFEDATAVEPTFAQCVRSALYLYHSALDDSHRISQDVDTATGSFLHGVMHRQEPDYSNAKYWFRRVGSHELFPTLREEALRLSLGAAALHGELERRREWDPFWFVDQVEQGVRAGSDEIREGLERIQQLEWRLLFDYSYRWALSG